ncbi:unnamed protein product [Amaranthus hypochondriacus]
MDAEKLIQKYRHVSREEIKEIRNINDHQGLSDSIDESTVGFLNRLREYERINGKESVLVGPLIYLLSVKFLANSLQDAPPTISGGIYTEYGDFEVVGLDGNGFLKLSDRQSPWPLTCMPYHCTRFVVDLAMGGKTLGKRYISYAEDTTDFEQVDEKVVVTDIGDFSLRYIAMPFAIYACVEVTFHHKHDSKLEGANHSFLDIKGKIIASNTCNSEACILFDKESDDFQRLDFEKQVHPLKGVHMNLSRCWVGLPAYSLIILDVNLMEHGSGQKLVKEILEFQVGDKHFPYKTFIVGDILIKVGVLWYSPMQNDRERAIMSEDESSEERMCAQETSEDDSDDEQMIESGVAEASSKLMRPWFGVHRSMPFPSSMVEIYAVYIGRDKLKALQLYGSIEVSTLGNAYYCFNREASDAFGLLEGSKNLPLLDGSLEYDDCDSFEVKIDLKDVEGLLCIKGYVNWDDRTLEHGTRWFNKPLCSFVEGQHGFAAICYSFFPRAVKANLMVLLAPKQKISSERFEGFPRVYGSITAQHGYFDYTSRYNKDYFRVTLFERSAENAMQTSADGVISLSRSIVVVPLDSTLVVGLDLSMCIGDNQVSFNSSADLKVGASNFNVESESNNYSVHINVKWLD